MDTLFVQLGLSIFLAGFALYLSMAARKGANWLFASLAFPPTILLFHIRFWNKSRLSAYAQVVGLSLLLFGFLAGVQTSPEKYNDTMLKPLVSWLNETHSLPTQNSIARIDEILNSQRENNGKLAGHVDSTAFKLDHVEYLNGVIKFVDTAHRQEISIFLGVDASQLPDQWSRLVLVDQLGPTVQISSSQFETRSYTLGYKLNLNLNRVGENQLRGNVELLIPDQRKSFIAGRFETYTDQVRYRGGDVDRTLENEDTIFYVIKDYLRQNFPEQVINVKEFSSVQRRYQDGVQHAIASTLVTMSDGQERNFDIYTVKRETGWEVSENNTTQLLTAVRTMQLAPPASGKKAFKIDEKPTVLDASKFLAMNNTPYVGRWMEVELNGGLTQRGILAGIDSNFVSLKTAGAGRDKAVLNIRRDNVVRVKIPQTK